MQFVAAPRPKRARPVRPLPLTIHAPPRLGGHNGLIGAPENVLLAHGLHLPAALEHPAHVVVHLSAFVFRLLSLGYLLKMVGANLP